MASLSLKNINKVYPNGFHAVKDFNLEIEDKEFIIFVGPSGCGKSTTLRMIAGLEEISSGELWIGDKLVNDVEPKDRDIAMVFQNYALYPHMTIRENIGFPLKNLKWNKDEAAKRIVEVAKTVKIDGLLDRKPSQLSGGQQQRVAIARALAKRPDILLLDEPLSNLDTKLRVETRQEIRRIQKETGVTAIFVTHDQEEAMSISDQIVLMKDGAIEQVSTPTDMYLNPVNKFVASFIGSPEMNFVNLKVKDGIGGIDNFTVNNLPKEKKNVILGFRAEDVEIADEGIGAKVETVEILGREKLLTLNHNDRKFKVLVENTFSIKEGKGIYIKPKVGKCYIFDEKTEEFIKKC